MDAAIRLTDVKKTFDGHDFVLKGMSLEIPKGSLTAIIGFSGTGKSVMLKHILGLFKPTSGKIEVLGTDISTLNQDDLTKFRCHFGVLFQSAALFDDMNVVENVCFPLLEHRRELPMKQVIEIAEEKLRLVGLDKKHFQKLPSQISGGMQKRTGLARALALDPEILVYDEPTTGLDAITSREISKLIVDTQKKFQTSSIIITHDMQCAKICGNRLMVIHEGQFIATGTYEELEKSEDKLVSAFFE